MSKVISLPIVPASRAGLLVGSERANTPLKKKGGVCREPGQPGVLIFDAELLEGLTPQSEFVCVGPRGPGQSRERLFGHTIFLQVVCFPNTPSFPNTQEYTRDDVNKQGTLLAFGGLLIKGILPFSGDMR